MDMQQYLEFLAPNSLFYEPIELKNSVENFSIETLNENFWEEQEDINWKYCINKKFSMPKQGWKIHITSDLNNAQKTLDYITPYLIANDISFKFVPNIERLLFKNSKNGDRSSSGKFITIYPLNEKQFLQLLPKLDFLLKDIERGPYILNDKRWKNSNVFFRYGGFLPMFVKHKGINVPAIEKPNGELIPDSRKPYYEVPSFIDEPKIIKNMTNEMDKFLEQEDTSKFDEYDVISALHFSNGGGVYKVKKNNEFFVMKEGRSKTGLDRLNLDGFERIKIESETLKKLKSKDYIVKYHDYFEIWENNYLIEEYIEGINLKEYISQNFPFSNKENKVAYKNKMITIIKQLYRCLEDLHKDNIALGDLQPNNIIITSNNIIKLIDLESSTSPLTKYNPGLMTPGYITKKASTFSQADWFALLRIARFIFLPIESLTELSIDIEKRQDYWIEKTFGYEALDIINEIKEKVLPTLDKLQNDLPLTISKTTMSKKNISSITKDLINSIESNFDFNSQNLINGDIRQYTDICGSLNIFNGAFGAIMAIDRSKGSVSSDLKKWISKSLEENKLLKNTKLSKLPIGLFNGVSGIATVLYDIGYKLESVKLLKAIAENLNIKNENITLSKGIAGLGLNYLCFYTITKDNTFLKKALEIYDYLKNYFENNKEILINDEFDMPYGLMNGWSGISLFILYMSEFLDNPNEGYNLSIEMLEYEIENNVNVNEELDIAQIEEYSLGHKRLIPYLGEGGAGVALVLIEFMKVCPNLISKKYTNLLHKMVNICTLYSTYASGVFRGASGMIILANANESIHKNESILEYTISSLNNYMLYNNQLGLVSPGEYGYRLSMDIQTGTSGILVALNDVSKNKWDSWIPLPKNRKLSIFKGGE